MLYACAQEPEPAQSFTTVQGAPVEEVVEIDGDVASDRATVVEEEENSREKEVEDAALHYQGTSCVDDSVPQPLETLVPSESPDPSEPAVQKPSAHSVPTTSDRPVRDSLCGQDVESLFRRIQETSSSKSLLMDKEMALQESIRLKMEEKRRIEEELSGLKASLTKVQAELRDFGDKTKGLKAQLLEIANAI